MGIMHEKDEVVSSLFTPRVSHVTVIANGFQPHSPVECRKSKCVMRWRTRCGLGVRKKVLGSGGISNLHLPQFTHLQCGTPPPPKDFGVSNCSAHGAIRKQWLRLPDPGTIDPGNCCFRRRCSGR